MHRRASRTANLEVAAGSGSPHGAAPVGGGSCPTVLDSQPPARVRSDSESVVGATG